MPGPEWQPGSHSGPSDRGGRWCTSSGSTLREIKQIDMVLVAKITMTVTVIIIIVPLLLQVVI